jgi:hypothetical protein
MESITKKPTLKNISKHVAKVFETAIRKALPLPDFVPQITWNATGSSDLSCPSAMRIYNMYNKKEGFEFPSSKEVANEIVANLEKDEIIGDVVVAQQLTGKQKEVKGNIKF